MARFDRVERIQLFALKRLLGVSKKTPNCLVYGETGRHPWFIDSRVRAVGYWLRLLKMDEDRIPRQAYTKELDSNKKKLNWAKEIKNILNRAGFGYI